jgi:uncharacterized repeat protein (TIGR03803 family)
VNLRNYAFWLGILIFTTATNLFGQQFTQVYSFSQAHQDTVRGTLTNWDGLNPNAGLTLAGDTLYGVAQGGGTNGSGTIYSLKTDGSAFAVLHTFSATSLNSTNMDTAISTNADGTTPGPQTRLILAGDTLYGTAHAGGTNGHGTIFSINTNGNAFNLVHTFGGEDGQGPVGVLLSGNTLYGNTTIGTSNFNGTIYSVNVDGSDFKVLHTFSASPSPNTNWDGARSQSGLVLGGDTLYGTANLGGANNQGTLFSIKTNGNDFTVLHTFAQDVYNPAISTYTNWDGANPYAGLTLIGNTLYGTAMKGGLNGFGTVFSLDTLGNNYTVLYAFAGDADGWFPAAGLLASGNTLFGAVSRGGNSDFGALFSISHNGLGYTQWQGFSGPDGRAPDSNLLLSGSTLYGTTSAGGGFSDGEIFSLSLPPLMITSFNFANADLIIQAAYGFAGETYSVLMSANPTLPLAHWTPVGSTSLTLNGDFSVTATNAVSIGAPARFFILQRD